MANTRIARLSSGAARYSGGASGLAVDSDDDRLYLNVDGTQRPMAVANLVPKTAAFTVASKESGTTFVFNDSTSIVATLPSTAKGLTYTFTVGALTSSGGHAISPAAADKIMGNGFTAADDKDAVCSAASDRIGDSMTIVGDGDLGWYITAVTGTWARES